VEEALERTLDQASRGEAGAVEALLVRYLPDLQAYLARHAGALVRGREEDEDLAQSVCREVLERLAEERFEYRGEAQFRQWLFGAALHKLRNRHRYHRAERRDAAREAAPPARDDEQSRWNALFATLMTPSQDAVRREDQARLLAAIAELPERHRKVLELVHLDGLPHREVAERLGIDEAHSRVLLARAMARLATIANRPGSAGR
jgi:RNA polymerase sigma-70 factor (ECF subfamily)